MIAALEQNSPLGKLLAAGLANRHRPREILMERLEDTGRHVVYELERFLNTLGTIAGVSPLLGLLGTVTGIIKAFNAINAGGAGDPRMLSGGIAEALVATAAGLCVAIPSLIAYRYLRGRVDRIVVEMEKNALRLADAVEARGAPRASCPRRRCTGKRLAQRWRAVERSHESQAAPQRGARDQRHLVDRCGAAAGGVLHAVVKLCRRGAAAHPPAAGELGAAEQRSSEALVVTVAAERHLSGQRPRADQFERRYAARGDPQERRGELRAAVPVTIRADGRASHQSVVTAMDVLARLGFTQMNLATIKPPPGGAEAGGAAAPP